MKNFVCLKCRADWKEQRARGLCNACYQVELHHGRLDRWPSMRRKRGVTVIVCKDCQREMKHKTRGLCATCANRHRLNGTLDQWELFGRGRPLKGVEIVGVR